MKLHKASPCKINLLLNVLGKREDGFHELETIMHPVALHDELEFERGGAGIHLTCTNPTLPIDERNLVFRAAARFLDRACIQEGVRIHLHKNVPLAAGLGGGSANAALTLVGLNELFEYPLGSADLTALASGIGSDVPFFLQDKPALALGRGESIQPLEFFPALRGTALLLIHPGFGVSTPWAYQNLARFPDALNGRPGRAQHLVGLLQKTEATKSATHFYNSLELPVLQKYPLLSMYQIFLRENGALGALMSGSGSTTFGLAEDLAAAEALADKFRRHFGSSPWLATIPPGG